jgi:hypothetical protein
MNAAVTEIAASSPAEFKPAFIPTERVTPTTGKEANPHGESMLPESFAATLGFLESRGVELGGKKEKILEAGAELTEQFGLTEKFFGDEVRSMMFASIANEYADLKDADVDTAKRTAHMEYIADLTVLLAGQESAYRDVYEQSIFRADFEISADAEQAVYERYTNQEVSRELTEAIQSGGLIDEVKEKMGITKESEAPFEIHVLNIMDAHANGAVGMLPSRPDILKDDSIPETDPEKRKAVEDHAYTAAAYKKYIDDLSANSTRFIEETGDVEAPPPAWVARINGTNLLCLPLPYAEKVLYKDEKRSDGYMEESYERDLAFLKHEYVHTQNVVMSDRNSFFGMGLEELRAEYFSGEKQGYYDIKRHFTYTGKAAGFNPRSIFETYGPEHPYSPADFYAQLAAKSGLDGALDAMLALPNAYMSSPKVNRLMASIQSYVGGMSGLQEKAWHRVESKGPQEVAAAEERMKEFIRIIEKQTDPERYLPYGAGDTFMVRKMLALWQKMKSAEAVAEQSS